MTGFIKKGIKQSIIVNSIEITKKGITVNTDRVLAVGHIRSAVAFPLQVFIESQTRTKDNSMLEFKFKKRPLAYAINGVCAASVVLLFYINIK